MTGIIFFNLCSIGDIYFAIPFIKWICNANPEKTFTMYTRFAYYLLQGIPNLKRFDERDFPMDHPENHEHYLYFRQFDRKILINYGGYILINTWVYPFNQLLENVDCDCSPRDLAVAYQRVFEEVNKLIEEPFLLPTLPKKEYLYKFPPLDIERFVEFQKAVGKETLFYFNRMGASTSTKPFTIEQDHFDILTQLSNIYPDKIIIVPNAKNKPDFPNVKSLEEFGIQENHTCKNVFEDIQIAGHCTYAIFFDIGSCFTFCNQDFFSYTAKFYHLSKNDVLLNRLRESIEFCLEKCVTNITYVHTNTPDEVVSEIQKRIV